MSAPRAFSNAVVAARLERLADLLELSGANPFRVRAYRNGAATVEAHPEPVGDLLARGAPLTDLKGVGKDLAAAIAALFETGAIPAFEELAREVPLGLLDVVQVPGVGPKRATTLWKELGVANLDDLERVAGEGKVAALAGFGAKTQAKVLAGVAQVRRRAGRRRLGDVDAWLRPLLEALRAVPGVRRIEVAGSVRRGRATIGDVDLLAVADDGGALMAALRDHPDVAEVLGSGATKTSVRLEGDLQVDLRVVPEASFGAAWQYFTGSKAHNVALRQRAIDRGLRLNEYGVFRGGGEGAEDDGGGDPQRGERVAGADEAEVYAALGLAWVPPELREDRGEVAQAAEDRLPRLLTVGDLKGDLHLHSTWSDGKGSVRAMRAACRAKGYAYHGLTDHSQALKMTGGLDAAKLARQWAELDEVAAEEAEAGAPMPALLRGLEVDILKDGALDLDEDWLARLDLVIVSVHGHFDLPQAEQTARIVRARPAPAGERPRAPDRAPPGRARRVRRRLGRRVRGGGGPRGGRRVQRLALPARPRRRGARPRGRGRLHRGRELRRALGRRASTSCASAWRPRAAPGWARSTCSTPGARHACARSWRSGPRPTRRERRTMKPRPRRAHRWFTASPRARVIIRSAPPRPARVAARRPTMPNAPRPHPTPRRALAWALAAALAWSALAARRRGSSGRPTTTSPTPCSSSLHAELVPCPVAVAEATVCFVAEPARAAPLAEALDAFVADHAGALVVGPWQSGNGAHRVTLRWGDDLWGGLEVWFAELGPSRVEGRLEHVAKRRD